MPSAPFAASGTRPLLDGQTVLSKNDTQRIRRKKYFDFLVGLSLLSFSFFSFSLLSSLSCFSFHSFFFLRFLLLLEAFPSLLPLPPLPAFSGGFQLSRFFCLPEFAPVKGQFGFTMALEFLQDYRPTIDRPFGIQLWPIFDKAFEYVMGYPASQFEFVRGETPFSTIESTGVMLVAYYIIIFGGREIMKSRPALKLNTLFMIHNLYLTLISGTLLALFIEQLLPTIWRNGIFYAICDYNGGWTQPLIIIYYVRNTTDLIKNPE